MCVKYIDLKNWEGRIVLKKFFLLMLCALCLAGCEGGSGGGSGSGGGDPKKEVQAMHDKYPKIALQSLTQSIEEGENIEDWSQEMLQHSVKYRQKFEEIVKEINNEKVSKGAETYKSALQNYVSSIGHVYEVTEKQIINQQENKQEAEQQSVQQWWSIVNQNYYELENEYSKAVKGKPALVMGIDGFNYLAFSSSKVDIAITKIREEKGTIGSNPFLQQEPMGKFVIVDVYMKNNQKDAITVDGNSFKLVDNEGREYSSSPEGHMALAVEQDSKAKGMLTRLNPNMGTSFTFVFDVPKELPFLTTKFEAKGGMTGKPTLMPLRPIKIETVKD